MPSPRLKGVILGAGYFSGFQFEAWARIPEVEIVANYNRTESRAVEKQRQFGIPRAYADWRRMIDVERPDFIDIITPPETHAEMCAYAADRGIAVICQKPLAPTLGEARHIVDHARAAGVRFMVHENWRWQPWWRAIKSIQQAGTIGAFTHLCFRLRTGDGWGERAYLDRQPFFREYPRLLVYETGVHFIDTFRYLFGEVETVYAQLRRLNPVIRGEETGQVFFRFRSGATAIWDANRYNESDSPNPRYTFGDLRIDGMGGHLTMDAGSTICLKPLDQPGYEHPYERKNANFAGDSVYFLQRHFADCMLAGRAFESTGEDYLKTLEVVEAEYQSAQRCEVVRLSEA